VSEHDDDPELTKLAELRADQWGCTRAEARERLLREAADERAAIDNPPESLSTALFAGAAFAAISAIEGGLWDRYLLRLQATIRARLATDEYGQSRRRAWQHK
jgi:hypothetical protein